MNAVAKIMPAVPDETKQEISNLAAVIARAEGFAIATNADYQSASDLLRDVKSRGKALDEKRKAITAPLDAAKKATMDMFRPATDAIGQIEGILKKKMGSFVAEQDRLRREAEAKAAEVARKEQEKLQAKADKLREKGCGEKADALDMQAASTVAVAPLIEAPAASGAHVRKVWKARLTDKMALIKAVAEGKASPELLDYNESVGNGLAKALKSGMNVPGVEAYEDVQVVAR